MRGAAVAVCFLLIRDAAAAAASLPDRLEFNRHVRPILADHCYACHGPDKGTRKADLRLDLAEAAYRGVGGRPALVPGRPAESEVIRRITATDPAARMPPAPHDPLSPRDVSLLQAWIRQGAAYQPHWAYLAPKRPDLPAPRAPARNPIDRFVLADLERRGIAPVPESDRVTLARRLSFDLRGLPPSPEEVAAFVADKEPDACDRLADRFLASPHFGERMAVSWLDLVRFADTVGYHGDQVAQTSPYRDYVIESFNGNLPFNRFTREQLAGDLLPGAGTREKVASAYNRLNMVTREGGAQAKEYLDKYAADRVRTTATAWLGASLGCAQCHDHKFDPYTMKDFYSFSAFFADVQEQGVYQSDDFNGLFPPAIDVPGAAQTQRLAAIAGRLAALDGERVQARARRDAALAAAPDPAALRADAARSAGLDGPGLDRAMAEWLTDFAVWRDAGFREDRAMVRGEDSGGGQREGAWTFTDRVAGRPVAGGAKVRQQQDKGLVQHFVLGLASPPEVRAGDRLYAKVYADAAHPPQTLMLQWNDGSWEHRVFWGEDRIEYGGIGKAGPAHLPRGAIPGTGGWIRLEIAAAEVGLAPGARVGGVAFTQFGGKAWWGEAGLVSAAADAPPAAVVAAAAREEGARRDADRAALLGEFAYRRSLAAAAAEAARLEGERAALVAATPKCMVTVAVPPREIRIRPRGNWMDDSGEVVAPASPHFLPAAAPATPGRLTRLDLADWVVSRENPLAARVFVNRLWRMFFGTGLSKTLDDLGTRGEYPAHADLLDWLAVEFMETGWDVKQMVRLMTTSDTYRRSSVPSPALAAADPQNRLHARQARARVDAEFVRDTALAVSGLLNPRIGGPSIRPYQPADYWRELNFPRRTYAPSEGDDLYRRGLYIHWQRTFLQPALMNFDAPSREECVAERPYANNPLQALTLLNDPTQVEAARVFAQRMMEEGGADADARLRWAFLRAVSRPPKASESAVLKDLLARHLEHYRGAADEAKKLRAVGQAPAAPGLDPAEHAAWISVARTILNLHETVTRM